MTKTLNVDAYDRLVTTQSAIWATLIHNEPSSGIVSLQCFVRGIIDERLDQLAEEAPDPLPAPTTLEVLGDLKSITEKTDRIIDGLVELRCSDEYGGQEMDGRGLTYDEGIYEEIKEVMRLLYDEQLYVEFN